MRLYQPPVRVETNSVDGALTEDQEQQRLVVTCPPTMRLTGN
jgi:hypothetical protein